MNANQPDTTIIKDDNEDKLVEQSSTDTSTESVSTEANMDISPELTPESVSTNLDSTEYKEDFQSSDQSVPSEIEEDQSQIKNQQQELSQSVLPEAEVDPNAQNETPPLTVDLPVKTDNNKIVSKTQKNYDIIINKANNIRKQFTKKRKDMHTWDDIQRHEWRNKISDTLIKIIRQSKNKNTLKHHHVKLKSMRNVFNFYLNRLSTSKQSAKNRTEKKSKK